MEGTGHVMVCVVIQVQDVIGIVVVTDLSARIVYTLHFERLVEIDGPDAPGLLAIILPLPSLAPCSPALTWP